MGTTWTDWAAAGLYAALSTQFAQRPGDVLHLIASVVIGMALGFRKRSPRLVLVVVVVLTALVVAMGIGSEPLIAAGWATAAAVSARPPRRWRRMLAALALLATLMVLFVGGDDQDGFSWGQWVVLSFLCIAAGTVFGWNEATTREAVESEARMRESAVLREERLRIAREIHDISSRTLVSIGVQASAAAAAGSDDDALRDSLRGIEVFSKQAAREIRRCLSGLRATTEKHDAGLGFDERIERVVARARRAGVRCEAMVTMEGIVVNAVQNGVCRALEESLINVAKHADGSGAVIRVNVDRAGGVDLIVDDRGPGFPATDAGEGLGLVGIRERVSALGGTVALSGSPAGGARVRVRVPAARSAS